MSPTILLIEDSEEIQIVEQALLEAHGYQVVLSCGQDSVEVAKRAHADLILLDLVLEEDTGEAVYAALHRDPETAAIPVIVTSASSRAVHIAQELGAQAALQKPFDVHSLIDYIEDNLRTAQERQTNGSQ